MFESFNHTEVPDLAKTLIYADSNALTVEPEVNDDMVVSPRSVAATASLVVTDYPDASEDDSESLIGDVTDFITNSLLDEEEEPTSMKSTESLNGDSIVDDSEFSIFDYSVSGKHDSPFQSSNPDLNSSDSPYGMNTLSLTALGHLNHVFDPGGVTALHEEEILADNPVLECDSSLRMLTPPQPPPKPPDIATLLMLLLEHSTLMD